MKKVSLSIFLLIAGSANAQTFYDTYSLNEGDYALEITGTDTMGAETRLSKVNSPYTMLYFYEEGCSHCDRILPVLINLYNEYRHSGLEIFAVPTLADRDKWIRFVGKNKLEWINVFLEEDELVKLRKDYCLFSTPTIYLLNKNKRVVGKKMRWGEEVERALKKYVHGETKSR